MRSPQQAPAALGTPKEVAQYLGIPEATLTAWRYHRTGPAFLRVGRHVRYRWTDVESWLAAQQAGGDAA